MGEGVWYTIQGSNVVFKDGKMDEEAQQPGPYMTSFRSLSYADIARKLEKSWQDCMRQKASLGIPLLSSVSEHQALSLNNADGDGNSIHVTPNISLGSALHHGQISPAHSSTDTQSSGKEHQVAAPSKDLPEKTAQPKDKSTHISASNNKESRKEKRVAKGTEAGCSNAITETSKLMKDIIRGVWPEGCNKLDQLFAARSRDRAQRSKLNMQVYRQWSRYSIPILKNLLSVSTAKESTLIIKQLTDTQCIAIEGASLEGDKMKALKFLLLELEKINKL